MLRGRNSKLLNVRLAIMSLDSSVGTGDKLDDLTGGDRFSVGIRDITSISALERSD